MYSVTVTKDQTPIKTLQNVSLEALADTLEREALSALQAYGSGSMEASWRDWAVFGPDSLTTVTYSPTPSLQAKA